jgi:mannosyltransferase OCH1-like enzyme
MGSKSLFANNLTQRKAVGPTSSSSPLSMMDSKLQPQVLPFVNSSRSKRSRKTKFNVEFFVKAIILFLKVTIGLFILSAASSLFYLLIMSLYNGRSVRDPCMVAETSKEKILQFLSTERDLTIQQTSLFAEKGSKIEFESKIPKIIHQQWKTETIPKKFMKWNQKWLDYYPKPEYTHMLWTDKNGRELIEQHYPQFLPTYDGYKHNINRADAARYFILHHYGGIYADLDYEPTTNFYQYLPQNQVAMVESPYYWNEKTQNCLMSSPKNDPFWLDLFTVLTKNAQKEEVLEATGPILLDQAIEYSTHPAYVLPCENFQRVPLGEYDQTLWTTIYDREIMFRLKPISKNCGYYSNKQCHFGKHHNTVSYRNTNGKVL